MPTKGSRGSSGGRRATPQAKGKVIRDFERGAAQDRAREAALRRQTSERAQRRKNA